jgi:NADH dehydrogenase FAD-containing subunit
MYRPHHVVIIGGGFGGLYAAQWLKRLPYDTLIVAAGASHHYFGHEEWEAHAPGLKTMEDAFSIRRIHAGILS